MSLYLHGHSPDAAEICKALGLDPMNTYSLCLRLEVGHLAQVTALVYSPRPESNPASGLPDGSQLRELGLVLKKYELREITA